MNNITRNWKTTIAGLAVALIAAGTALGYITEVQATAIMGALTAIGFSLSKDGDKTGIVKKTNDDSGDTPPVGPGKP